MECLYVKEVAVCGWKKGRRPHEMWVMLSAGVRLVLALGHPSRLCVDPPSLALVIIFWRGVRENFAPSRVCEIFCGPPSVITVIGRAIENEVRWHANRAELQ